MNVSHFSTFALLGETTTQTTSGGTSGSGGSTGGGGVASSEPFDNIAVYDRKEKNLIANTPVTYSFKPGLGVYEIVITGKQNENFIAIRVEALKGTSKLVSVSPPGEVYKNINIWAGTKRIKEVLIRFKVENSWISQNNFATDEIKMLKWDSSKWVELETSEKAKDDSYTYYEAKSQSLSMFAIVGLKAVAMPTPTVEVTETPIKETPTPTPTKKKRIPGFEAAMSLIAIAILIVFRNKRR